MGLRRRIFGTLAVALLRAVLMLCLLAPVLQAGASGWSQATGPRQWRFPADHGAHPAYRTEWWYFTGNLADDRGKRYGYQLTFFREGVRVEAEDPSDPWSLRDLYLAHFTITDETAKRFSADERMSRTGPGLAGCHTGGLDVHLLDWSAMMRGRTLFVRARNDVMEIDLELEARKPPALHGEQGLSRKGPGPGQASFYASCTDLVTTGRLKAAGSSVPQAVKGVSWFDHEFGSNQLDPKQSGWDWFGLHLSDGRDLMLYLIRRTDGTVEPASSGTLVDRQGESRHLPLSAVRVEVLDHWKSQKSGAAYPSRWRITVAGAALDLLVSPLLPDQELITSRSTGVTYWEGAVTGNGTAGGRNVTCLGYVEMTGYAASMGGLF